MGFEVRSWRVGAALCVGGLALVGCGGGGDDSPSTTLTGTAAIGAPIGNATVTVKNAAGTTATGTTAANGSFSVSIGGAGPFVLSVTSAGSTWYSYAQAAGVANLTPLTTLALLQANHHQPLATLFQNWSTSTALSASAVLDAAKKVSANLQAQMQAKQVNAASTNVFTHAFTANGTGLDAVLDGLKVSYSCSANSCTQTVNNAANQTAVTWNWNVDSSAMTFSWTAPTGGGGSTGGTVTANLGSCAPGAAAGSYSAVIKVSAAGQSSEACVNGLPSAPTGQSDFCAMGLIQQQLPQGFTVNSCSYNGSTRVGTLGASFQGMSATIEITFVQR